MAIGSIFAEFDLDYTKFDKNKQKLEASATSTVVAMEKQWDHLTEKQMDEYGQMVAYVKRKHDEILADTTKTAQEQARAYTVAADRMKRINADMAYEAEKTAKANQENANWWIAKKKTETQAVEEFQAAMAKQKKEEMALNEKTNKQNAEWWIAKRKVEADAAKESQANAAAQAREDQALNEKRNRQNAEWWIAKRKFDEDEVKKAHANYTTLGVMSKAHYGQKKSDITASYKAITAAGEADFRVQKAYKEKLKQLDREYAGQSDLNMKGIVRGALTVYAAFYAVSQVLRTVASLLKAGFEAADQMKTSAIAVAASITTAQGNPENYRKNYEYASALVLKLREVDKVSFASYENILLMNRAMELQGVHLDMNSKAQMSTFTALTNAVALYTAGQDQAKQAAQEFRSIFSGNIKAGSEVAKIIDEQAKASGKYANGLKDIIKQSNGHKDVLAKIQPFLIGIEASVKDIAKTWESATTTLKSSWDRLLMSTTEALFPNAIQDIKDFSGAIDAVRPVTSLWLREFHDGLITVSLVLEKLTSAVVKVHPAMALLKGLSFENFLGGVAPGAKIASAAYKAMAQSLYDTDENYRKMVKSSLDFKMAMEDWKPFPEGGFFRDYKEAKQVADEFGKIYWYVKGLKETPDAGPDPERIAENLRSQIRNLASRKEAAKDIYEMEMRSADQREKLAIAEGKWALTAIQTTLDDKTKAIKKYNNTLRGFAEEEITIERKKAEASEQDFDPIQTRFDKMSALESEMKRAQQAADEDYDRKAETTRQRMVDETAKAYETMGKYSKEATQARIDDINREYNARASYTAKAINEAARERALSLVGPTMTKERTDERIGVLGVVAPYSDEAMDAFEENLRAQGALIDEQFNNQMEKENWLTIKILEEIEKRKAAQAGYYDGISGFSSKAYDTTVEAIIATRDKEIALGYDATAANKKAAQAIGAANEKRFDAEHADILKVTSATANMFGSAKALMDENSREYALAHNAQMAMQAIEIAIQAEKNLMIAVGAVLNQGTGDPYTAFARMAAMAAAVAGVLSIVGIGFTSFGSKGGGEPVNPNVYANSDDASQSATTTNIASILKDSHASEYTRLTGIYQEVRDLNDNIVGLARGLSVRGGFSAGNPTFGEETWLSNTKSALQGYSDARKYSGMSFFSGEFLLEDLYADVAEKILGGSTETSRVGAGLSLSGTMGSGAIGQFFEDLKEVTDGGWLHSDETRFSTNFSAIDAETNRLLTQVFSNLGGTLEELAGGFGMDIKAKLEASAIDIGKIDLMGKSASEISEELTAVFSAYGDKLAQEMFGSITDKYQNLNEGALETAVRLLNDQVNVEEIFKMTRITADASIELSESLLKIAGGLDELKEAASTYYDAFFSDAEKQIDRQSSLNEAVSQLGYILPGTRQGFRDLVESTKAMTATNQEAYVSLLSMAGKADEYYSYVEEKQGEILSSFKSQLSAVQNALKSFTTETSESVVASIDDIIRRTRAGIAVPSDELNAALSAATSKDTSMFGSGVAYDLNRARNAAALMELESATSEWVSPDEAQLAVLEQQAATLNTLTAMTAQTNEAIAGDAGTVVLLGEIKGLLTNNGVYVKRISDTIEEINDAGVEIRS